MARRKKKQDILDRLMDNFSLRGFLLHQATLFVAASCLVIGGVMFLWKNNQSSIVDVKDYLLTTQKIEIPEPPSWVDLDPRELILSAEKNTSILDPQLVSTTAKEVKRMPFVDQIHSISKSKSGLEIELSYRRPVAIVLINSDTMPGMIKNNTRIKLAVDRNGIVMPKRLSETPKLPIISVPFPVKRQTQLNTWSDWPDQRVRDAAKISQHFAGRDLGVFRVVTSQKPGKLKQEQPFELWSVSGVYGTRIIWGVEPDSQGGKEATVQQKLTAINDLIARLGPLGPVAEQRNQPLGRVFDVRSGQAVELPRNKVAAMPDIKF